MFLKAQGHLVFVLLKRKKNSEWSLTVVICWRRKAQKHFGRRLFGRHFDTEDSGKRVSLIKIVK